VIIIIFDRKAHKYRLEKSDSSLSNIYDMYSYLENDMAYLIASIAKYSAFMNVDVFFNIASIFSSSCMDFIFIYNPPYPIEAVGSRNKPYSVVNELRYTLNVDYGISELSEDGYPTGLDHSKYDIFLDITADKIFVDQYRYRGIPKIAQIITMTKSCVDQIYWLKQNFCFKKGGDRISNTTQKLINFY
jgi:hypothetical protein